MTVVGGIIIDWAAVACIWAAAAFFFGVGVDK
jgi:hypothetical protein